jgi:hypothetical protein
MAGEILSGEVQARSRRRINIFRRKTAATSNYNVAEGDVVEGGLGLRFSVPAWLGTQDQEDRPPGRISTMLRNIPHPRGRLGESLAAVAALGVLGVAAGVSVSLIGTGQPDTGQHQPASNPDTLKLVPAVGADRADILKGVYGFASLVDEALKHPEIPRISGLLNPSRGTKGLQVERFLDNNGITQEIKINVVPDNSRSGRAVSTITQDSVYALGVEAVASFQTQNHVGIGDVLQAGTKYEKIDATDGTMYKVTEPKGTLFVQIFHNAGGGSVVSVTGINETTYPLGTPSYETKDKAAQLPSFTPVRRVYA